MKTIPVEVILETKNDVMKEVLPLGFKTSLNVHEGEDKVTFLGANGETYSDYWIRGNIGQIGLAKVFKKL
jgi:hypothetical protein